MSYRILVASALAFACATSALAQDTTAAAAPAPAAAAAPAKPVKEHKLCRQDVATGSIMPHSTCHTKAEWAQVDAQNQQNAQAFQDQRRNATGH